MDDTQYDAAGRVTQHMLGEDTVQKSYTYYPWDITNYGGLLEQILTQTTGENPTTYQNLSYTYDRNGNVSVIEDWVIGDPQTQSFLYDNLDRLTRGEATGGTEGKGDYSQEDYNYDLVTGNLLTKAGVSYTYGDSAHTHAVTALSHGNGEFTMPMVT